ncbi:MAG TPA: transcription termination factor NusA [Chloroflexota bacterium]
MKSPFEASISQLCSEKGVPREVVMEAIEAALISAYRRNFNAAGQNVVAEIDPATGMYHILALKEVVPDGEEETPSRLPLSKARAIKPDAQVGETLRVDVTPANFGRIAAQTAKQVVLQKLRDAERKLVYDEYVEREGEIVFGIVQRIENRNVIVELGRAEAIMPPAEQVPTERYVPGQRLRVYLVEVQDTPRGPQLIVSRSHRLMLRRLFEQEVPEVYNGTVEIKAIAREAGSRSKVAVAARQEGIDPVGACVGVRGVRIQNIVNELNGEKVDIVPWSPDPATFVANALSPAQALRVELREADRTALVVVPDRQLSLAIGKEGQNARLAAKLTGWRIDIKSESAVSASRDDGPVAAEGERDAAETPSASQVASPET